MRKLPRSLRLILLAAAVAVASYQPATQAQSSGYNCWEGTCLVCCDTLTGCCVSACPWGDSYWC